MSLANVVAAGVQPQARVSVLLAVLFAVVQHPLQHVGDGAVVTSSIARRQHHNVPVPGFARISLEVARIAWHVPVPLGLRLEVAGLWLVVVGLDGYYRFGGRIVPVVVDGHVTVESEEDDADGDERDGDYYGSANVMSAVWQYRAAA